MLLTVQHDSHAFTSGSRRATVNCSRPVVLPVVWPRRPAHLRGLTPLPQAELRAIRQPTSELAVADVIAVPDFESILPGLMAYDDLHEQRVQTIWRRVRFFATALEA